MPIINQKTLFTFGGEIASTLAGFEAHFAGRYNLEISSRNYRAVERFNTVLRENPKLRTPWKSYPRAYRIQLPRDPKWQADIDAASFGSILKGRRSVRRYTGESIDIGRVSELLFAAWGDGTRDRQFSAPSGGARLPIEIYLCIFRIKDIAPGLYHFNRREHSLELIEEAPDAAALMETVNELGMNDPHIGFENANFAVILTAVFQRTLKKYSNRGWRFILFDAGHLGQNLWLTGSALKLGVCGFGAGFDSRVAARLRINPLSEAPLVSYVFGIPADGPGVK